MSAQMMDDSIPTFSNDADTKSGVANSLSGLGGGLGIQSAQEVLAIVAVAAFMIGGAELLLRHFAVPSYVMPAPSAIVYALFAHMPEIAPHLGHTMVELVVGYTIGASIGIMLAALITQFPFSEKITTPYILLLVTTPMLALVPLLILNFGFGYAPRFIAVALAVGPMVMINSATGFRRVDLAKIALARSFGASTLQISPRSAFPWRCQW
jgi:NitT/TauT family transport system permease protein